MSYIFIFPLKGYCQNSVQLRKKYMFLGDLESSTIEQLIFFMSRLPNKVILYLSRIMQF